MPEHVLTEIGAYLDGELPGRRLVQVQVHLDGCAQCQAELQALRNLSQRLKATPLSLDVPGAAVFASRVMLRLPQNRTLSAELDKSHSMPAAGLIKVGWQLAPAVLLVAWIFVETVFRLSGWVSAAGLLGLLNDTSAWLAPAADSSAWLSANMNLLGLLPGQTMAQWAVSGEAFGRYAWTQVTWQSAIALLYLGWLAVWWSKEAVSHQRSDNPINLLNL